MRLAYKYRLFPTKTQRQALESALELCRWVYNQTLALRKDAWEQEERSVSYFETKRMLPLWKEQKPALAAVHSQVLQDVTLRVNLAFKAFFRRLEAGEKPGYPRFKGRGWYDSITYPQYGNGVKLDGDKLVLSKIGAIEIGLHRQPQGTIKTVVLRRNALGNWYACLSCEVERRALEPSPNTVGVDVGLTWFATLSTGEQIENPRFFRQDEKDLAKAQRKLQAAKNTPDYGPRKRTVQHIHKRIANRRKDFAHKLSRRLVNEFQVIAFEDLDIQEMQTHNGTGVNKSIGDVAWHQFVQFTTYKAASAGRSCVRVDPRNTTKACSTCGEIVPKARSERIHTCPQCGLTLDRDHNAALNILARGLACMGSHSLEAHHLLPWEQSPQPLI
jgi:putative transposase